MILWRYLIRTYLRIFFLAVGTFVSILLVSRFKDIARFAVMSNDPIQTGLYAVYQIPFILPMAIPLSALISSFLLFSTLSRSQEITAFRAAGLSIQKILTPLFAAAMFLGLANFSILADIAPICRQRARELLFRGTTHNPLLLLQRQQSDVFVRTDEDSTILVAYNESNHHLNLVSADQLTIGESEISGNNVAMVSYLPNDTLVIENQESMVTATPLLTGAIKKTQHKIDGSGLSLKMLRVRMGVTKRIWKSAIVEIFRRSSLSIAVLSFTLLGAIFGMEMGRVPSKKHLFHALFLTLTLLSSFFLGKNLRYQLMSASIVYFVPHFLIYCACYWRARTIARGTA